MLQNNDPTSYDKYVEYFKEYDEEERKSKHRVLIQILIKAVDDGYRFLFLIDELDFIEDEDIFKRWADFFIVLNNQVKKNVLTIIFIAPKEIDKFWKGSRLTRLPDPEKKALNPGLTFKGFL